VQDFDEASFFLESHHFNGWNILASVVDIHSLLRVVGYYKKFIKGISKISKPITKLLGKDKKFKWMPACEVSS
jgi:hypothetical protein